MTKHLEPIASKPMESSIYLAQYTFCWVS